jgi:Ran GTPase-activating protein (RanGAP) involved in mRNA processing and transport
LKLRGNVIGDEGAQALASSEYLDGLETLDLARNDIGDEGARALADSPYLCESIRSYWAGQTE